MSENEERPPSVDNFSAITDFDAGTYAAKINVALLEAAKAAVMVGRQSKVVLAIKIDPIAQTRQVHITHAIQKTVPRLTGTTVDTDEKKSTMHVHRNGQLSPYDEDQMGFSFQKEGGDK